MQYDHFDVEIFEGVATLRFIGSEAATLGALGDEFLDIMLRLQEDRAARAILITDGDNAFEVPDCRDGLTREGAQVDSHRLLAVDLENVRRVVTLIQEIAKPVVTATRGAVRNAGLGFYMAGDVRLAGSTATFAAPDPVSGLLPDWGLTFSLPRLIGPGRSLDFLWSRRTLGASEAAAIGLVDRIIEEAAWDEDLSAYMTRLATLPQPAVRLAKLAAQQAPRFDLTSILSYEYEAQQQCLESLETVEGLAAWQQGRAPVFQIPVHEDDED